MKKAYINSIPLEHGEITVVAADHAEAMMRHSARLAADARKAGMDTLVINCGMSDKRYRSHLYAAQGGESYKNTKLIVKSSVRGNLAGDGEMFSEIIRGAKIGMVIITGWEFASDSYRRRQRLISYLRGLMEDEDVVVVIYVNTPTTPIAGKIDHGGIGKLSALALYVCQIEAADVLEVEVPKPVPIVIHSQDEIGKAEEWAQQVTNKINNLYPHVPTKQFEEHLVTN